MTIHSWSGIGIKTKLDRYDLNKIISSEHIARRVRKTKVLIIEEVSMLLPETLSMVDAVCREIRQNREPFGGMQVVFAGDFFQLPPVVKTEVEDNTQVVLFKKSPPRFVYDSPVWMEVNPVICYLTQQYRQNDSNFLAVLTAIRHNVFNNDHLHHIVARKIDKHAIPNNIPKLFPHNVDVDRINDEMLSFLAGEQRVFTALTHGPDFLVTALKRGCLSPEMLYLKVGASVMFTKNNPKMGFMNGTLGIVEEFDKSSGYPVVKIRSDQRIETEPMDWTVEENGAVRARITQLPLRLAWAITVHKSQGMSLDSAVMDLSDVFEFGQGYVALSRVKNLSGLYILGWNERAFQVSAEILVKDEAFRLASNDTERMLSEISLIELQKRQENFISLCGGKTVLWRVTGSNSMPSRQSGFERIRRTYQNAYRLWDIKQDEKLRELFSNGWSVTDLTKAFGRKYGAIRSRLAKLGLVGN